MAFIGGNPNVNWLNLVPQSADPTSPNEGDFYLSDGTARAEGLWVYQNSAWSQVGSGQGATNYMDGGSFEASIAIASTFNDPTNYTDGTGGSVAGLTLSQNSTTPLFGTKDLKVSKAAVDSSGDGVTLLSSTINKADLGRKLWFSMEWDGTAANYVSEDLGMYAYDVTNSVTLPFIPVAGFLQTSGVATLPKLKTKVLGYVVPNGTTAQVRISAYLKTDNASGSTWDVFLDEAKLSTEATVPGAIISEWQDFPSVAAGTLITGTTTNPSYGTTAVNKAQWRRVGSDMEIRWDYRQTTAGTAGSGIYLLNLPAGYSIDTTAHPALANTGIGITDSTVGTFYISYSTTAVGVGRVSVYSPTQLRIEDIRVNSGSPGQGVWGATDLPFSFSANMTFSIQAKMKIASWVPSAALTTTEIGLQSVAVFAEATGSHTASGSSQNPTWNKLKDNYNALSGSGVFTVPKTAQYHISANLIMANNGTGTRTISIFKNGNQYALSPTVQSGAESSAANTTISASPYLVKGDTIEIRAFQNSGGSLAYNLGTVTTTMSIVEVQDFTTFAAVADTQTAYIKDVKASGTTGGTFTSGAWQTRTLNTLSGDTTFLSLAANQFTLQPGVYFIEADAVAFAVDHHQTKLRNITASSDVIIGNTGRTGAGDSVNNISRLADKVIVSVPTTFELQHRCETTKTGNGFGSAANFGVNEVYATVKITRRG